MSLSQQSQLYIVGQSCFEPDFQAAAMSCEAEFQDEVKMELYKAESGGFNVESDNSEYSTHLIYDKVREAVKCEVDVKSSSYDLTSQLEGIMWQPEYDTASRASSNRSSVVVHDSLSEMMQSLRCSVNVKGKGRMKQTLRIISNLVRGMLDSRTTKSILYFLQSYAKMSRFKYSRCSNSSIAGAIVLTCEECSLQFTGLHDRFLKLSCHYKTAHKHKCNKLIAKKLVKHHTTLINMARAWQLDTEEKCFC